MLVNFVAIRRFILAVILVFSAVFPVHADTKCEPTEKFYDGVAQKALGKLQELSPKLQAYNTHVQQAVFDSSGPCYILNTYIERSSAKNYNWSGFDASGASQSGQTAVNEIKQLLSSMDFSNIDIDYSAYDYKNSGFLSSANISLQTVKDAANQQKLTQDLKLYQQCKTELFNLGQEQSTIQDLRNDASSYLTALANQPSTTCSCDDSGTITACSTVSDSPEAESSKELSCKNLNEYTQDTAFCPTCIIFERILIADQKLAGGAFGVLADSLVKILSLGFLLFLAYQTLILVSSPANQPMSKYLTSLAAQGFKVTIAILILTNPSFLFDLALKPIIEGSLDFGITLTGKGQADIVAAGSKYTKFNTTDALLSAPFLQKMVGAAEVFNEQAAIMPAMGRAMICDAFTNLDWNVIPNIETMLEGVMVVVFGYIISLSVGFYLLDITLELGFFCCLLPFLITCWPFKLTNGYVKRAGWEIFMHIFFTFVMLGVIITAINAIIKSALSPNHDIKELINALNTNDFNMIKEMMEIGGLQMVFLIVACYICIKLLRDVDNMANKFAGGVGFNISPKIGGLAASTIFAGGMGGGKAFLKGLTAGADGLSAVSKASGFTGYAKEKGNKISSALGFNKVQQYMAQKKGQVQNFISQTKGQIGVGANAQVHGGRAGNNSDNQTSSGNSSGGSTS